MAEASNGKSNGAAPGTANIGGTGNAAGNVLTGNAEDNVLSGLDGNDVLAVYAVTKGAVDRARRGDEALHLAARG